MPSDGEVRHDRRVPTLVLLRHGESDWNSSNRFSGWVDVALTARGEEQARHSGRLLREAGLLPAVVHTSALTRAIRTSHLVLAELDRLWVPVQSTWRLNERCYGALQGRERSAVRRDVGDAQFQLWRRSYDAAPPPVEVGSPWDVADDPRYAHLPPELVPRSESLADVTARLLPHWCDRIVPDLRAGRTVLVVAHGNALRALVAHLDSLDPQELMRLNIPTGMPLRYALDDHLLPTGRGGAYLEPDAARRAAAEVAAQGTRSLPGPHPAGG
jgi:2,3-bisphosphoglycerate-dependent phosphoglycerate mutase